MRRVAAAVLAAAVLGLGACKDDPTGPVFEVIEEVTFDPSLGIDLADYTELASGVWILDLTVGTGDVFGAGGSATLNYSGWLANGTLFDAFDGYSFPDNLGRRPIPGFEIGLDGTAEGGMRRMIIPPELAYPDGARDGAGNYVIPPGAVVIFEVELVTAD